MVVGILGAIAQEDVRRIFSFYIVSQIGYIIMGLGLFTVAGLAGAVYAIVHHIVVKTTLFLVGGLIEHHGGSSRLSRLGGMVATAPAVAVLFLLPALSLAGIPPFSGFAAKFGLFDATARSGQWTILAVAVLVSLLTLFSIFKIWIAVFWSPRDRRRAAPADAHRRPSRRRCRPAHAAAGRRVLMLVPTTVLAVLTLVIGVVRRAAVRAQRAGGGRPRRPDALPRGGARAVRSLGLRRRRPGRDLGAAVGFGVAGQRAVGPRHRRRARHARARPAPTRRGRFAFRPVAIARLVGHMVVVTRHAPTSS